MKRITSASILKQYLGLDNSINVVMTNSIIEIYDGAHLQIDGDVAFNNASIILFENSKLTMGSDISLRGKIIVQNNSVVNIGNRLACNGDMFIHSAEKSAINIGNDCLFANPQIYNSDLHAYYDRDYGIRLNLSKDVNIEDNVWLASEVMILKGTYISKGSLVGAGAVVSKKFHDENVIIAGNPGKIIKKNIHWTRKIYESQALELSLCGTPEEFVFAARSGRHLDVISIGMPVYSKWKDMTQENSYIYYYLARSIFLEYFQNEDKSCMVGGMLIDILDLFLILHLAYRKTNSMNYACGAYAYKLAKLLQKNELATELYEEIYPKWNAIKGF